MNDYGNLYFLCMYLKHHCISAFKPTNQADDDDDDEWICRARHK